MISWPTQAVSSIIKREGGLCRENRQGTFGCVDVRQTIDGKPYPTRAKYLEKQCQLQQAGQEMWT